MVRLYDITDTMRDVVSGTMEMYLSVVNNRMNDVMKTLTVITTLFMPLTFLIGLLRHELLPGDFSPGCVDGPGGVRPDAAGHDLGAGCHVCVDAQTLVALAPHDLTAVKSI